MGQITIKRGLDLPIIGEPVQTIDSGKSVRHVAILGGDYVGMKPTMLVKEGETVKVGQPVFTDKKNEKVRYTAPGAGKVVSINRGAKRAFLSMIIELDNQESAESFTAHKEADLAGLTREQVSDQLLESGLWPSLRVRPFSKVADPEAPPHSIFITAMDTNPLAPDMHVVLKGNEAHFKNGVTVLSRLTDGKVYVCTGPEVKLPALDAPKATVEVFSGPHPAGNVGTHIHFLEPVSRNRHVWHVTAQDVVAIGHLFTTGKLYLDRIVSLAGPGVANPRLLKTRLGASLEELTAGELNDGDQRVISGSVWSGHIAADEIRFLGKYAQQVTVLSEGREKEFLGWMAPGFDKFSIKNLVASRMLPGKKFAFTTALNGGQRAIVPIGNYEKVMPLDIIPTFLLRAMAVDDVEDAEKLGILELDEEDLALCTFVCQSKLDYGPMLRRNLTIIEKEG